MEYSEKDQAYISNILTLIEDEDDLDLLLNWPNFMGNGIIIPMLLIIAFCFKALTRTYILQVTKDNIMVWKYWFWRQKFFQPEASTIFFFLNRNILFPECSKKDQTYISVILTLFEYTLRIKIKFKNKCKNDLDLFLNGPNFIKNGIHSYAAHKGDFFTSYSPEGISFSSKSMNMRALVKVLILAIGFFLSLVLRNYYSLNAPHFRRL